MSDPTRKSEPTLADEINALIAGRHQARVHVANLLAMVSQWSGNAHFLTYLDLGGYSKLRSALDELYGAAGNLMSDLAPWKDPEPARDMPLTAEPVRIPDDEDQKEAVDVANATG